MDRMQHLLVNTKETCKSFAAWVRNPKNALIAAIVFLAVSVGIVLFIEFVLPTLLLVIVILLIVTNGDISGFFSTNAPPPDTLENESVAWTATNFIFYITASLSSVLSGFVIMPQAVNDMFFTSNYLGMLHNAPVLQLHILRTQAAISASDCDFLKNVLQSTITARLNNGYLQGYLWAVPAAYDLPLVYVVSVEDTGMYLHINILLTNTTTSVQAARLSNNPTPPPTGNDIDPLFSEVD